MKKIMLIVLITLFTALTFDTVNASAAQDTSLLEYLGITIEQSDTVTKGAFVETVMKLSGYSALATDARKIYIDTVDKAEQTAYINAAVEYGIAQPRGNGRFGTSDEINTYDAVLISLNALGYGEYTSLRGVINTARAAKLKYPDGEKLNSDSMAQLLFSMLESPRMQPVVGQRQGLLSSDSSDTILKSVYGLTKYSGLVNANAYGTLDSARDADVFSLEVNYKEYSTGSTDYASLIGYNIIYYADSDDVIRFAQKDNNKNRTLTLKADSVEKISPNRLYWDGEKQSSAALDNTASVFVNGRFYGKYVLPFITLDTIYKSCGNVTLVDNDADSMYDVVFAEDYATDVISRVDMENEIVYLEKSGKRIALSDYRKADIYVDGQKTEITSLFPNTAVSVMENGGGYVAIFESTGEVVGTVNTLEDKYAYIGNEKYILSHEISVELGDKITALTDVFGRIVHIKSIDSGKRLGYLVDFKPLNTIGGEWEYRIFTENGEMKIYSSAKRLRIDGTKTSDLYNSLCAYNEKGELLYAKDATVRFDQMISFAENDKGEIIEITTAHRGYKQNCFSCAYSNESAQLFNESGLIDMNYRYTSQTKVIYVPDDRSDYRYYRVDKPSFDNQRVYNMMLYNLNENYDIGLLVVYENGLKSKVDLLETQTSLDNPILLVDKVSVATGDDGGEIHIISGIREGKRITVRAEEDEYVSVHCGDILRCNYSDDAITAMYVEYCTDTNILNKSNSDYSGYAEYTYAGNVNYAQAVWCYGQISAVHGDSLAYVKGRTASFRLDRGAFSRVYVYEKATRTARIGSFAELCEGDEVSVNVHRGRCFEIVVYR